MLNKPLLRRIIRAVIVGRCDGNNMDVKHKHRTFKQSWRNKECQVHLLRNKRMKSKNQIKGSIC